MSLLFGKKYFVQETAKEMKPVTFWESWSSSSHAGLVLKEFFQSVQTTASIKESAGHTEWMNSKCSGTSFEETLAGGKPKCKASIWKCYMGANI